MKKTKHTQTGKDKINWDELLVGKDRIVLQKGREIMNKQMRLMNRCKDKRLLALYLVGKCKEWKKEVNRDRVNTACFVIQTYCVIKIMLWFSKVMVEIYP